MVTDFCERMCFICFEKAPSKKKTMLFSISKSRCLTPPNQKKKTSFLLTKRPTKWSSTRSVSQRFPPKGEVWQVYDECRCRSCWGRVLSEAYTFFPFVENVGKCHPGWLVSLVGDWLGLCRFCMLSLSLPLSLFLRFSLVPFVLFFSGHLFLLKSRQIVFFRMVRQRKGGV